MNSVGSGGGGLAKAAIEAALKSQADALQRIRDQVPSQAAEATGGSVEAPKFGDVLTTGLDEVQAELDKVDALPADILSGKVHDVHEIAFQLQKAQLSYDFALQVRNKLIDAYREVMRMSV